MALVVDQAGPAAGTDEAMAKLVLKAQSLRNRLIADDSASVTEFADREGSSKSYITRLARIAYNNHNRHVFDGPNFELRQLDTNVAM
jgi:hypothetical protein